MKIELQRLGDRPLAFSGAPLAEADTRQDKGAGNSRWWRLALYRADSGELILAIGYRSLWEGESDTDHALVADSAEELVAQAQAHDFLQGCKGFPRGMEERQAKLVEELRMFWLAGLTEALSALEPEALP